MVWLIPTIVTLLSSYLSGMFLFDLVSAVAIAVSVIVFTYLYFSDLESDYVKEGIMIGVFWVMISMVLDVVLILIGITKLNLTQYIVYVAPLYVIIPAITIGFGLYRDQMSVTS